MLKCFEEYFGPYPFYTDGYKLVEAPHLGMEHQSAIAYGNQYMRGYLGGMIPEDMNWDYAIVHESGQRPPVAHRAPHPSQTTWPRTAHPPAQR